MKPLFLAAMLAAGAAGADGPKGPVKVFVGPMVRDGFVDADKGVLDSVKDLQGELRKNRAFSVVAVEAAATLKLYVISRATSTAGTAAVVTTGNATGTATSTGAYAQGTSTSMAVPNVRNRLETLLRVGDYEKPIAVENDWVMGQWKHCAGDLVKDLTAWVKANRERLP